MTEQEAQKKREEFEYMLKGFLQAQAMFLSDLARWADGLLANTEPVKKKFHVN